MIGNFRRLACPAGTNGCGEALHWQPPPDSPEWPIKTATSTASIHQLWDELADIPAARSDRALEHLMRTLCRWLRADDACWIGAVRMARGQAAGRDVLHGWRARATHALQEGPARLRLAQQAIREQEYDPGLSTIALVEGAGKFRVHRLRDGFVDFERFRRTRHFQTYYHDLGVSDRLFTVFPIHADAESYIYFDSHRPRRRFSRRDAALAGEVMRGLKWFHRNLMLSHGLPLAEQPLTPTQHRLLRQLLSGGSETHIAERMKLTRATTHTYITRLYRQFGVNSRAALTALWLSQSTSSQTPSK